MTSQSTILKTREHIAKVVAETNFSEKNILIFLQNEVPTINFDGQLLLKSKGLILTNPGKVFLFILYYSYTY